MGASGFEPVTSLVDYDACSYFAGYYDMTQYTGDILFKLVIVVVVTMFLYDFFKVFIAKLYSKIK